MNNYDLSNRNGKPLCHGYGCRRWRDLIVAYRGLWCKKHLKEITALRERISPHRGDQDEIDARIEELRLRKVMEPSHWNYVANLERQLQARSTSA